VGEAMHVFINGGLEAVLRRGEFEVATHHKVAILEMGFGTGLNALLTLKRARRQGIVVDYTAVELYPVSPETVARLDYAGEEFFPALHSAPWGEATEIAPGFRLTKLHADFEVLPLPPEGFEVVYFDAFAPDTQPELWTAEIFARLHSVLRPGGVLVTYSAKGSVRRAMLQAGFRVEKLAGAIGKRHMLRAIK
jgi:tRNA U34 5-methylaminomethyl-2-thiouridine-forming methyltransferase MnmC